MNTVVLEKNEQGLEVPTDVFAKMAKSRALFINGHLDDEQATDIIATLLYLRTQKVKDPKVNLFLNCYCYDVRSVLMLTDVIVSLKDMPIRSVVIGEASGLAALLLTVSDEARAGENSMIHIGPLRPETKVSKAEDLDRYMSRIKVDEKKIISLYSKKLKKSVKETQEMLMKDHYLTSKESLKLGLIDSVIGAK